MSENDRATNDDGSSGDTPEGSEQGSKQKSSWKKKNQRNQNRSKAPSAPATPKFTGKEAGLGEEFVYSLTEGPQAGNQYRKTTDEIIRYCGVKYVGKGGEDVVVSLRAMKKETFTVDKTKAPDKTKDEIGYDLWYVKAKATTLRGVQLESLLKAVYQLILGQCERSVLDKVKARADWKTIDPELDCISLLKAVRESMHAVNARVYLPMAIAKLMFSNTCTKQTKFMSCSEYFEEFQVQLDVLKEAGGDISTQPGIVEDELAAAGHTGTKDKSKIEAATTRARAKFEAVLFLLHADQRRFGALIQELANDFNKKDDNYPDTVSDTFELMANDVRLEDTKQQALGPGGMAFAQDGDEDPVQATDTQPNPRPKRRHLPPVWKGRSLQEQLQGEARCERYGSLHSRERDSARVQSSSGRRCPA
uniref:Uncharacterized protein n=1 Tax=Grammatophora oceanica TaxID=210454 RepID=A0A6U5LIK2_9STRA|mmetsp:Transcript_33668/g.49891  ORF Transcript_33668/g.49891 Transcript_33668/m.49891 type:complete len:419 (+) Transcript_33668:798-2054(+)